MKLSLSQPLKNNTFPFTIMKTLWTDQDGTLIKEAPIGVVTQRYCFEDVNNEYLKQFYDGEISYDELMSSTVRELIKRRATRKDLTDIFRSLTPMPGLQNLLANLNGSGLAIISGGLVDISEVHGITPHFQETHGVRLLYDEQGFLKGYISFEGTKEGKYECFENVRQRKRIAYHDVVYMGDSGNDVLIAKRIVENGGTFLFVQPEEAHEHCYKRREEQHILEMEKIATATIQTLDEALLHLD